MRIVSMIVMFLVIGLGIAFAALNAKAVTVHYLIGETQLPLAVVLMVALFVGILLSMLFMGFGLLRLKAKNKWLESKLKHAQANLQQSTH